MNRKVAVSAVVSASLAMAVFAGAPAANAATLVAPASVSTASTSNTGEITLSSMTPIGNGQMDQSYSYVQTIPKAALTVGNASANTKVQLYKLDPGMEQAVFVKQFTPTAKNGSTWTYSIDVPRPEEGSWNGYAIYIPAHDGKDDVWSDFVYLQMKERATLNLSSQTNIFTGGNKSEAKVIDAPLAPFYEVRYSNISKGSGAIYLQRYDTGTSSWVTVQTAKKTANADGTFAMSYTIPKMNAGQTVSYRLYHPATNVVKEWTSATSKVTYTFAKTSFAKESWGDLKTRWPVNTSQKLDFVQAKNGQGQTVQLQKYDTKAQKWVTVSKGKLNNDIWARGTVIVPAVKNQSTVKYRFYLPATSTTASSVSASKTVNYIDPRKYTGYKKSLYSEMKRYCPNIIIDTTKKTESWSGLAWMTEKRVEIVTGLKGANLEYVAVHECAHILQEVVYPDHEQREKVLDKVYGKGDGVEANADCMAKKMGVSSSYRAFYTNNCSGARGTAATKILQGKKL